MLRDWNSVVPVSGIDADVDPRLDEIAVTAAVDAERAGDRRPREPQAELQAVAALGLEIRVRNGADVELRQVEADVDVVERRRAEAVRVLQEQRDIVAHAPADPELRRERTLVDADRRRIRVVFRIHRVHGRLQPVPVGAQRRDQRPAPVAGPPLVLDVDPGLANRGHREIPHRQRFAEDRRRRRAGRRGWSAARRAARPRASRRTRGRRSAGAGRRRS